MRRRSRLHWGAVGREAADQCGEEFTRGGACRGSPSSVESRAQRALCTPAAGTRSQARCTWAWRPQYTPTHKVSKLGRPVHLRTLIATSLWMMIRHPPSGSHRFGKTALQSDVSRPWSALEPWILTSWNGEEPVFLKMLSFSMPEMEAPGEEPFLEDTLLSTHPAFDEQIQGGRVGEGTGGPF
ncbi:uncharacterized protein LOC142856268 isoform X2 [Microtus pennsylvanicus]|uniref:uncharacterized protein LOC142856268 isoform X2 n=1 Tax=Microtus pennsylvanicus TaxID=10058 RepID=UPI003F6B07BA